MAIREMTRPPQARTRKAKYPFSEAEVKQAIQMLKAGKTPGVGPYEGDAAIREARSASQSLVRHINASDPSLKLGTRAWVDGDEASAIVVLKDN